MQFAARLVTLSAAITQALALVQLTNSNWDVTEGVAFDIKWTDANGPVTLLLKDGPSKNLATVTTIASGQTGDSYSWTPTDIASGTYAIEIDDSTDTNYGSQFVYSGTASVTTTTSAATTASTVTTASTETTASASTTESSSAASTLTTSTVSSSSNSSSTASSTAASSTKSSATSGTSSSSTATNTPLDTNNSQKMGSPLALVLLTFAAIMLCH